MAEIILMPKMTLIMEEGLLGRWHKSVGDEVAEDEILFSVENEKEVGEVPSTAAGVLLKIWGAEGERYPIKTPMALIGDPGEDISEIVAQVEKELAGGKEATVETSAVATAPAAKTGGAGVRMLPKLRKMVREKGIDLEELLAFTGESRITEKDIMNFEASRRLFAGIPDDASGCRA